MDQQVEQRDIVIKVKYGDTLRRIGASVNGKLMDHNMSKLRAKIISLFKFSLDTDLILTYTDIDGDVVTLDDDDELRDAVISQRLNPLRITVQLKSKPDTPAVESPQTETTTVEEPLKSTPDPLMSVLSTILSVADKAISNSPASEVIKSEPFKSVMKNIHKDLKKATSFSPALATLAEQLSKVGLSDANQTGPTNESSNVPHGSSANPVDLNVSDVSRASDGPVQNTNESDASVPKQNVTAPSGAPGTLYPIEELLGSISSAKRYSDNNGKGKEAVDPDGYGKLVVASDLSAPKQASHASNTFWVPSPPYPPPPYPLPYLPPPPPPYCPPYPSHVDHLTGSFNLQVPNETQSSSKIATHPGIPINREAESLCPALHPYRRSQFSGESTPQTFHRGVQCDGCGMHPIVGPRFKSKVKDDYDLCDACYNQMGNEDEYTRIDGAVHRAPRLFKGIHNHSSRRFPALTPVRGYNLKPHRVKLESRFIQDVTVLDGTVVSPLTHFTKIWRLRNTGTGAWPFGTQLVWVGGDQFGDRMSTNLEIPSFGFPVDEELDVAVDFTAPSRPGRYVSYWRMASPSGQKFGQRVWVLIQVDQTRPNSASGYSFQPVLNLNLPPEIATRDPSIMIDVNAQPLYDDVPEANVTHTTENVAVQPVEPQPAQAVGDLVDITANDDGSKSTPFDPSLVAAALADNSEDNDYGKSVEQSLLNELEEMGFKQNELNKEVLRRNEYNLELSVDDLCGFSEWDPMLAELREMGFTNMALNKKMLTKNGGSIKRAVLDLIAGKME